MATTTQLYDSLEGRSSIGVVPYSTTVARQPEKFDLQHHSSFTIAFRAKLRKRGIIFPSSVVEKARLREFGLDLIHGLVRRRSQAGPTTGSSRYDGIFDEHIENEDGAQRSAKLDIPEPAESSRAPEADKYADWKKRFVAMKNKHTATIRGKRSSLRTWLSHESDKSEPETRNATVHVDSSDGSVRPLRRKKSLKLRVREWSSRSAVDVSEAPEVPAVPVTFSRSASVKSNRNAGNADTGSNTAATPLRRRKSLKRRMQKWSSRSTVDVSEVPKVPAAFSRSASTKSTRNASTARSNDNPTPQAPKKAASTDSLHTQMSYDNYHENCYRDQQNTHPTLRAQPHTRSNPSLRALHQPYTKRTSSLRALDPIDERSLHPSLRSQPFVRLNPSPHLPVNNIHTNNDKDIKDSKHNRTNKTNINPNPNSNSKPPLLHGKTDLVRSLNIARSLVCARPLDLHPLLSNRAQDYIRTKLPPVPPPKPNPLPLPSSRIPVAVAVAVAGGAAAAAAARNNSTTSRRRIRHHHHRQSHQSQQPVTKIETIAFKNPHTAASAVRLVSPPGLGALACGELWAGGKYKRHKTTAASAAVPGTYQQLEQQQQQHRFTLLPDFDADGRDRLATVGSVSSFVSSRGCGSVEGSESGSGGGSGDLRPSCGCAEYDSWATVTDRKWEFVGVGRAEDGRWVVELWEGVSER